MTGPVELRPSEWVQLCMVDDISAQQPCPRLAQWRWHPDEEDHPVYLCNFHAEPLTAGTASCEKRP